MFFFKINFAIIIITKVKKTFQSIVNFSLKKGVSKTYIGFLEVSYQETGHQYFEINSGKAGFVGTINNGDRFGWSISRIPDSDGDSVPELAIASPNDKSPNNGAGAVYILFLKGVPQVSVAQVALPALQVQVYPNPARDVLQFDFGQMPSSEASVQVFDMHGRLLLSQEIQTHTNPPIDVSSIQTIGVYKLQIHCNGSVLHKKVLIEK